MDKKSIASGMQIGVLALELIVALWQAKEVFRVEYSRAKKMEEEKKKKNKKNRVKAK